MDQQKQPLRFEASVSSSKKNMTIPWEISSLRWLEWYSWSSLKYLQVHILSTIIEIEIEKYEILKSWVLA